MNIFRLRAYRVSRLEFGLLVVLTLAGCGESGPDVNVRLPERERPDVDEAALSGGRRKIPADSAFNIASFTSGQQGQQARGSSAAVGTDGATCEAKVTGEGSSWGAFQLGYTFDNMTNRAINATVRLRLDAKASLTREGSAPDQSTQPSGSANLTFVVKDTLGVVVRQEVLCSATIATGPREESRRHDVVFDAKLEPNRGYYLVIAGRADATTPKDLSADVSIGVSGVSLEIEWNAATASTQPAGG